MTPIERRRHIRIDSFNLSYISVDENGSIVNQGIGRTLNVSESGILLETNFQTSLDQGVSLTIAFEENLIDLKGRFIHFKAFGEGIYQTGVEFLGVDDDAKAVIVRYIQMFERSGAASLSSLSTYSTHDSKGSQMGNAVVETRFPELDLLARGKVRDIYDLGDALLMVATDRISAYDVVLPTPIPGKGKVLTRISLFWFDIMKPLVDNHVITGDVDQFPEVCAPYKDILRDRSMLVRKAKTIPIECVVRGYLSGSGWKSYQESKTVCGIALPEGLKESEKLPEAIFTPSTKADVGEHDINIDFEETARRIGRPLAEKIKTLSLAIYQKGVDMAGQKGIIIADTKFEFGMIDGKVILIDEILTPDSSRFWPKGTYAPGGAQKSYDKQYVRDYLTSIAWDKQAPGPILPSEVIRNTREKYLEALVSLTGKPYVL